MNKLLVICGPTATGKTQTAVNLAKKFNGEIVSADSRQVYRGMDIATGKDLETYGDVPVHMLDVVEPTQDFSVAQYYASAVRVIREIWEKNKLPILVGGTGLYIKALVDGIDTLRVLPNMRLREKYASKNADELFEILHKLNPDLAASLNRSDKKNKRRLMRKIELVVGSKGNDDISIYHQRREMDVLMIGLTALRDRLYKMIDERVEKRMNCGMVEEVEGLLKTGVSHERLQSFGLEYKWIDDYLVEKIIRDEMVKILKNKIHALAKRQMTWFKRDSRIIWFDIESPNWSENVEKKVNEWYNS